MLHFDASPLLPVARVFLAVVVVASLLPVTLQGLGVDFSSLGDLPEVGAWIPLSSSKIVERLHYVLRGSFVHTILEWSSVCTAIFTVILSLTHYAFSRDVVTPLIGIAMFFAGCMDAFHTFAADHLLEGAADNHDLIPFTWAICRTFSAVILCGGTLLLLRRGQQKFLDGFKIISLTSVVLGTLAYGLVLWCVNTTHLPQTTFPGSWLVRPYDFAPLILFITAGIFVLPHFYRQYPSLFSLSLWFSMVPQIAVQMHMTFGSGQLFDGHFNVAHFLKIVAYLVPFGGICLTYIQIYREKEQVLKQLGDSLAEAVGLNAILEHLADGLLVVDVHGMVSRWNQKFLQLLTIPATKLADQHHRELAIAPLSEVIDRSRSVPTEIVCHEVPLAHERVGMAIATGVFRPGDRTNQNWLGIAVLIRDITNEREVDKMKT
ncbi:MAG: hypothetical protein HC919_14730, partial [Oscillatoriales cyanobacterium SM2_2_1]|nr:hypothetical protein [Oscillatoriales cyanobacterium SM2_2_1]